MWKKIFRTKNSLEYRKRFKCPKCKQYSLHIIHDSACECEDNCDVDDVDIGKIFKKDDFDSYYTSQDLEEYFYNIDDKCNSILSEMSPSKSYNMLSKSQVKSIDKLFNNTLEIDEAIDDLLANYFNLKEPNGIEQKSEMAYYVNLLEDTHFFLNLTCKDLLLCDYAFELVDKNFYSIRFFYNNGVEHLFQTYERVFILLGILYGYEFDDNIELNKTYKIEKFIKKNEDYKKSGINEILSKLKSNAMYSELKDFRQYNDHDLSLLNKKIIDEIEKDNQRFEFYNREGNLIDKDILFDKINNILFCNNLIYNLLLCIIDESIRNINEIEKNKIPMVAKFYEEKAYGNFSMYDISDFESMQRSVNDLFGKIVLNQNSVIKDAFFRLAETNHCLADVYNIINGSFYSRWKNYAVDFYGLIDEQYLLYSALFRCYACYDKLARFIASKYEEANGITYFSDLIKNNFTSTIINDLKTIACSEPYQYLYELRNDIYHNLRLGCLYGEDGLEHYNQILFDITYKNCKIIVDIIKNIQM